MLSACTEIDSPISSKDTVLKIETKWLADSNGVKKLMVYNKEYDRSGKLIKLVEYDSLGQAQKIHKYQYSDKEQKETIEYANPVNANALVSKIYSSIDENGKIVTRIETGLLGDTLSTFNYKYDSKGNLVSANAKYTSTQSNILTEYKYNSSGSLENTICKDVVTGHIIKTDSLIYNYQRSTVDKVTTDNLGNVKTIISTSYNKFGKVYKEIENDPNKKIINTYIYEYIFY